MPTTTNTTNDVTSIRTRTASLRLSTEMNAYEIAKELDNWNNLLGINFPGVGYYDSSPIMEEVGGKWVMKFPLTADDTFWNAYNSPDFQFENDDAETIVISSNEFERDNRLAV